VGCVALAEAGRDFAHDLHNLEHNDIAIAAGGTFEQVPDRGADLGLSVVWTAKIPIVLI
jgi:hypothetical protein